MVILLVLLFCDCRLKLSDNEEQYIKENISQPDEVYKLTIRQPRYNQKSVSIKAKKKILVQVEKNQIVLVKMWQ